MNKHHGKRKRRTARQALKNGKAAKAAHRLKAGRTGSVFTKILKSRKGS